MPQGAGAEWRAHWPVVLAAFSGMGMSTIAQYTVSLFIEPIEGKPALEGSQRIGAVTAFGREVGGYQVTVVGEVPTVTTRRIAESIAVR